MCPDFPCETSVDCSPAPAGELLIGEVAASNRIAFSLVVPTLNESHNIAELISLLKPSIVSAVGESYEIVVVDDDSPDGTWCVAADLAREDSHIVALRRVGERGLATAVIRGWQASRGNLLGVIDADLQHPPEIISKLISAMSNGSDVAIASRDVEGGGTSDWSFIRQLISKGSRALGKVLLPGVLSRVSDPMSGFFIIRRTAVKDVALAPRGYKILLELLVRANITKIVEVGYVFRSRQRDESKASIKVFIDYIQHLFQLRTTANELRNEQKAAEAYSNAMAAGRD